MNFVATKRAVANRGVPPDSFLSALVLWGRTAPAEIFAQNDNQQDIYSLIAPVLGNDTKPRWNGLPHRRAAMLEVMRVHAGFEASWNFNEDVDLSNASSLSSRVKRETGVFQVSFDSLRLDKDHTLIACLDRFGVVGVESFIRQMKSNHVLAFEFYARLVRERIDWAGPLLSIHGATPKVLQYVSKDAVAEFQTLLTPV